MQVNIDNRAPPSAAPRSTTVAVRITCSQPESCWRVDRAVSPDHFRQLDINRERSIEIPCFGKRLLAQESAAAPYATGSAAPGRRFQRHADSLRPGGISPVTYQIADPSGDVRVY